MSYVKEMGLRGKLTDFIDSLIPPEEKSNNYLLYQTAFLRVALLTVLSLIGSGAAFLYSYMDYQEDDIYVSMMEFLVGCVLLANPLIARKYKNLERTATFSIFLFGSVFLVAIFDELPEDKSSLIWLSVVPALSFILKGRRGIYWALGYLSIHFGLIVISRKVNMDALTDAYLSYIIVTVIFYFYAWMSERYREVWESIARTDSLTGVLNRVAFEDILHRELSRANRYDGELSLIIFDIDNFKSINDNYGHLFGDRVLRTIASIVSDSLRATDVFARWGGEEFIVLLPNTDVQRALSVAEKLRRRIQAYRFRGGLSVTASFGITGRAKDDDPTNLVMRADRALYRAKEKGKNRVEYVG